MPRRRYDERSILTVDKNLYENLLKNRNINSIVHYNTPSYNYDISGDIPFKVEQRVWKDGDRLFKLSQEYYGSIEYWWVIAFINQKPTDSHFQVGDIIMIPSPLEEVLKYIGVYN